MRYEIWLGNDDTHFHHGIAHPDDGRTQQLTVFCNVGNFQDSLHIGIKDENGFFDMLRWFPYPGVIKFYNWDEAELAEIILHNTSDHDILVWEYDYLKPGETAVINIDTPTRNEGYLMRSTPVGLGRLAETNNQYASELIGTYGLISTQMERIAVADGGFYKHAKTVRFAPASFFRGQENVRGLEVREAMLTYNAGQMIIESTEYRYVFTYDKGDGHNG